MATGVQGQERCDRIGDHIWDGEKWMKIGSLEFYSFMWVLTAETYGMTVHQLNEEVNKAGRDW